MSDEIKIKVGPLGELTAAISPEVVLSIESEIGGIYGITRRFVETQSSFTDCVVVIFRAVDAGMPDTAPSRAEIQKAVLAMGVADAALAVRPILDRIMGGSG